MSDLEIRLRTSEDVKAAPLGTIPLGTPLESIINLVSSWGVSTPYGEFGCDELSAHFVFDGTSAFFEVIVNVDEE